MKIKIWQKLLAFLLVMMLMVSSLPMTALAAELQQNDEVYSVNMPVSSSDTLDLTDKASGFTFHVYDDGGADANYSNGCSGKLTIQAPEGCVLIVSGSLVIQDGKDWLGLYDGTSTYASKLLDTYYSKDLVGINTTGTALTIWFWSDSSTNDAGLDLTVTVIDPSSASTVSYAYGNSTKTMLCMPGAEISLPTFDSLFTPPERQSLQYWLCGETHYAEGDPFTVTENVTFTAVLADDPVILHSEAYENYALTP